MVNIMTLKISPGAFDGMCSEFHGWRCTVARAAGFGIAKDCDGEGIILDWNAITDANIVGVWTTPPADPLLVLFAHSDIEGTIGTSDALALADRLTELLIPAKWRAVTKKFIAACRLATYRNEPMAFAWDTVATIRRLTEDALLNKLFANEMMQRLRSDGLSVH
jgi:hypothetical protein